jgi:predicted unusual protein kinase regulating ubiquinone biosynthesis (AarF/ABC1/UbiB family)/DNA-binding XRE family transcriptional regulator
LSHAYNVCGDEVKQLKPTCNLKEFRESLGLTQRQLAQEFQVTHGAIALWESGKRSVPGPILRLIEIYESELGIQNQLEPVLPNINRLEHRWISRNIKLSLAMGRLIAETTGDFLKRTIGIEPRRDITAAEILAGTLGNLKGVVMKAGQMVGYMEMDLHEDFKTAFEPLHYSSRAIDPQIIKNIIEGDFGRPLAELFSAWEPVPVACGSMGQVHKATLKNKKVVAVKVQYPGIKESIEADLNNTKIAELLSFVLFSRQDKKALLTELSSKLLEECDYNREALNQERIGFLLKGLVSVPSVNWDLSNSRILASDFVSGLNFKDFCQQASQGARNKVGTAIFESVLSLIFRHRILYTDPNPGNFLIDNDRVHLVDFGSIKNLTEDFVENWREYLIAVMKKDENAAKALVVKMGFVPHTSDYDFEFHHKMFSRLYQPWNDAKPFKFSPLYMKELWQFIMKKNPNILKGKIPKDWIFLIRLQWGLFSLLSMLGAEANWNSILLEIINPDKSNPRY